MIWVRGRGRREGGGGGGHSGVAELDSCMKGTMKLGVQSLCLLSTWRR